MAGCFNIEDIKYSISNLLCFIFRRQTERSISEARHRNKTLKDSTKRLLRFITQLFEFYRTSF